jgi:iron complex transport system substrate-binding protein
MRSVLLFPGALAVAAIAGAGWWAASAQARAVTEKPRRIVSLNLCTDQLLLALADRGQIVGLTRNAADPQMSAEAARARGLPILRQSAEQVLAADPDLAVGMPMGAGGAAGVLRGRYRTLDIEPANSLADIRVSIRQVAHAVGNVPRGDALVADMDRQLAAVARPGGGRTAAYYQRRGFLTGTGTLIDDLMARVGLVNLADRLGKPALAQLSLEELVAARPDFLIVESATDVITDQGSEMLHHPALRDIPRISIPQAWTVCGGPAYVRAARSMADQIARHPPHADRHVPRRPHQKATLSPP